MCLDDCALQLGKACKQPKPKGELHSVGEKIAQKTKGSKSTKVDGWKCPNCTCQNGHDKHNCMVCGEANPKSMHSSWGGATAVEEEEVDDSKNGTAKVVGDKWFCSHCHCENEANAIDCCMCGKPCAGTGTNDGVDTEPVLLVEYNGVQVYQQDLCRLTFNDGWMDENCVNFLWKYLQHHEFKKFKKEIKGRLLFVPPFSHNISESAMSDLAGGLELSRSTLEMAFIPVPGKASKHKEHSKKGKSSNEPHAQPSFHWSLLVYNHGRFDHYDSNLNKNIKRAQTLAGKFMQMLAFSEPSAKKGRRAIMVAPLAMPPHRRGCDAGLHMFLVAEYLAGVHLGTVKRCGKADWISKYDVDGNE
jgi:hypothetical protein